MCHHVARPVRKDTATDRRAAGDSAKGAGFGGRESGRFEGTRQRGIERDAQRIGETENQLARQTRKGRARHQIPHG